MWLFKILFIPFWHKNWSKKVQYFCTELCDLKFSEIDLKKSLLVRIGMARIWWGKSYIFVCEGVGLGSLVTTTWHLTLWSLVNRQATRCTSALWRCGQCECRVRYFTFVWLFPPKLAVLPRSCCCIAVDSGISQLAHKWVKNGDNSGTC